jgi:D-psicose/D-tagatose/L-ribulose 3-epimerase
MNKIGIYFAYWTKSWTGDYKYYIDKVARLGFDILEVQPDQLLNIPRTELVSLHQMANDRGLELTYCIGFPQDRDLASESPSVRPVWNTPSRLDIIHFMDGKILAASTIPLASCLPQPTRRQATLSRAKHPVCQEISKVAEDYGITYCLEIVNRFEHFLLNTAEEGVAMWMQSAVLMSSCSLDAFHMNIEKTA